MKFITGSSLQSLKVFLSKFLTWTGTLRVILTVLGPNHSGEKLRIVNKTQLTYRTPGEAGELRAAEGPGATRGLRIQDCWKGIYRRQKGSPGPG